MNRKSELPEMMNVMVRKPKLLKERGNNDTSSERQEAPQIVKRIWKSKKIKDQGFSASSAEILLLSFVH